jgi:hypothetical protein
MTCIDTQTRTTRERLLHDYYTTCTDIDRYRHTHTYTHITYTHIYTHNTHTHTYTHRTHTQYTHTHTYNTHTHAHTHTTQEAANYVAAEVRRAARSGELHSCGPKITGGKGSGSRL